MSVNKKENVNTVEDKQKTEKKVIGTTSEEETLLKYNADYMRRVAINKHNEMAYEFIDDYIRDEAEDGKMSVIVEMDRIEFDQEEMTERVYIEEKLRELGYTIKTSCKENKTINKYRYTEVCWN